MSISMDFGIDSIVSPYEELLAYEYLWTEQGSSYKKMSENLIKNSLLPTEYLHQKYSSLFNEPLTNMNNIKNIIDSKQGKFSIILKENIQYPDQLLDAKYPLNLFYYKGDLDILKTKLISVVGTRKISQEGIRRTKKLVSMLCENDFTIVSGLAEGTDTVALETAIEVGKRVVGVIGTPIDVYYPHQNKQLQDIISYEHLLISQVPFYKYLTQPFSTRKYYFTERNATMAALSKATVIVEAGETSGTLVQARACIDQGRPLFILNSCFENKNITWPAKYESKGAIRVRDIVDILSYLDK